jgi:predicted nuclease of predicted toxin-antitoxin system
VRFKLDENLDVRLAPLLAAGGHDADTVRDQALSGASDRQLYDRCRQERRTFVTLDLDFANPFLFPPEPAAGIIVLRPPKPLLPMIRATLTTALTEILTGNVEGALWIVEPGRIRVHQRAEEREGQETREY